MKKSSLLGGQGTQDTLLLQLQGGILSTELSQLCLSLLLASCNVKLQELSSLSVLLRQQVSLHLPASQLSLLIGSESVLRSVRKLEPLRSCRVGTLKHIQPPAEPACSTLPSWPC